MSFKMIQLSICGHAGEWQLQLMATNLNYLEQFIVIFNCYETLFYVLKSMYYSYNLFVCGNIFEFGEREEKIYQAGLLAPRVGSGASNSLWRVQTAPITFIRRDCWKRLKRRKWSCFFLGQSGRGVYCSSSHTIFLHQLSMSICDCISVCIYIVVTFYQRIKRKLVVTSR